MKALLGTGVTLLACVLVAQCQTDTRPFLFFATEAKVLKAQRDPSESTGFEHWRVVQQLNITGVTALDVDTFESKFYWINSVKKRIYRLSIGENESESECIVCCCLGSPEGLAVDWLGRNLYWTDSDLHTIEIAKLDGSERTIFATIPNEMGGPSLVKVDPIRGDLYWSPKSGSVIYQMRMDDLSDDSNPRISVFWQDPSNQNVVGIAVNYTTSDGSDYIYWAVSGQHVTRRFKKPLGANQDSSIQDSLSDFNVLDMEILGDHIYYILDSVFTDQIRNDDTQADLLYSAVYGETSFTDMVFLHHSHQPVPPPSVEITSEDTPVNNRPYTATCVATFPVPVPLGSVVIEATDIYGINLTLLDRITFSSIRQIDERTFARDLTVNPITFFDSGTYGCSASLRNNFIIGHPDSAYINVTVLDAPLPAPEVIGLCTNVVWYVPAVSCEGIQGYDVRLFQPQSAHPNVTRRVGSNATFYILQDHHQMDRSRDGLYVQVRVIHSNGVGEWSEGTSVGCESPTPTPTPETPSVYFEINGEIYFNNSAIPISEIGEGDNAIYCRTDKVDCCGTRPNRFGEFYYPNGVKVPVNAQRHGFYRNRGEQIVRLNRREGVRSPTGTYRCEVPNANGEMVKIYITLVSS